MPAIPTVYRGVQFRSRIEARWAAFFDLVGWQWEYEPIDLDGYIPDFILQWYRPTLVEIKSAVLLDDLCEATSKIDASGWAGEALVFGAVWHAELAGPHGKYSCWLDSYYVGQVKEVEWWGREASWYDAAFSLCTECKQLGLISSEGCYRCRICGAYEGDHFVDGFWGTRHGRARNRAERLTRLERAWSVAGNAVQWNAPKYSADRPRRIEFFD